MEPVTVNEMTTFFERVCNTVANNSTVVTNLQDQVNSQASKIDELLRTVELLKGDVANEKNQNAELQARVDNLVRENNDLIQLAASEEQKAANANSELSALRNLIISRDQAVEAANSEIGKLRESLTHAEELAYHRAQVIDEHRATIERVVHERDTWQEKHSYASRSADEGWQKFGEASDKLAAIQRMFAAPAAPENVYPFGEAVNQ